jgi:hypothetical protein
MNKTSYNERLKLTASFLNTIAAAVLSVGGLGPIVGYATGLPTTLTLEQLIEMAAVCIGIGLILHFLGRSIVGDLVE